MRAPGPPRYEAQEADPEPSESLVNFVSSIGAHLKEDAPIPAFPAEPDQAGQAKALYSLLRSCHRHPEEFDDLAFDIKRRSMLDEVHVVWSDNHVTLDLDARFRVLFEVFERSTALGCDDVSALASVVLASNRRAAGYLAESEQYARRALELSNSSGSNRARKLAFFELAMLRCGIDEDIYLSEAESVPLGNDDEDLIVTAKVLYARALSARWHNDLPAADRRLEEAVEVYHKAGYSFGEARALVRRGTYKRLSGDFDQATSFLKTGLVMAKANRFPRVEAIALLDLGQICKAQRRDLEAKVKLDAARALFRGIKFSLGEAHCLSSLASLARRNGDIADAILHAAAAYELYLEYDKRTGRGDSVPTGLAMRRLGQCLRDAGQLDEAEDFLDRAIGVFEKLENPDGLGMALASKAKLVAARGDTTAALQLALDGLQLVSEMPGRFWQGRGDDEVRPHDWCYRSAAKLAVECEEMSTAQEVTKASHWDLELRDLRRRLTARPGEVGSLMRGLVQVERLMRPSACDPPGVTREKTPTDATDALAIERERLLEELSRYVPSVGRALRTEILPFGRK